MKKHTSLYNIQINLKTSKETTQGNINEKICQNKQPSVSINN